MHTITTPLDQFHIKYPIERLASPDQILFLDIETTGFTARSSYLYLIGCSYYKDHTWTITQWMAENYTEEARILEAFFTFASSYAYLIHFNGNNFDLPFLMQKCAQLELSYSLDNFTGIDIYKRIAPLKFFLKLPNCKQKTIEQYLGLNREDPFTGGELIGLYHDFVKSPSEYVKNTLLLHNENDIKGMLEILPILSFHDMFQDELKAKKVQANYYKDYNGHSRQELIMTIQLAHEVPVPIRSSAKDCYVKVEDASAVIKVPIYEEELKYFYSNYHDYYYLPGEDVALHRSVSSFVDKEFRVLATAATCYTRKVACYLPQWEVLFEPFYKRDYKSKDLFFELTDEFKKDRVAFAKYAKHILEMVAASY